ncbi:hypothetical protein MRB53_031799 [Persea americana]|uniref:Uncharacterized protein n=1 Tax=Persea americana TaxID=3435 RepID=A0ACC2KQJ8_PERAE|nr:hypothetical protein MRB53_031799 [Persea americana]
MCLLRLILVFLSAILAGYFAWKSIRSDSPKPQDDVSDEKDKVIGKGFWTFVDMASGRYLWRNLKPPSPGAPTIRGDCDVTSYSDLCFSSIISRPGSSNFSSDDVCKAAVEVTIENATDTRHQISKMLLRGSLVPASMRALRECEKQYDLALYNLTSA